MFENLRSAFREAVSNFKDELGRDEVPEAVDELLKGMQIEVTDCQTQVKSLEEGAIEMRTGKMGTGSRYRRCMSHPSCSGLGARGPASALVLEESYRRIRQGHIFRGRKNRHIPLAAEGRLPVR